MIRRLGYSLFQLQHWTVQDWWIHVGSQAGVGVSHDHRLLCSLVLREAVDELLDAILYEQWLQA